MKVLTRLLGQINIAWHYIWINWGPVLDWKMFHLLILQVLCDNFHMETHLLLIYLIFFSFKKNLTFKKMQSFPSVFDWMLCVAGFMKLSIYFHILGLILYFGLRLVLLLCFWWQQFPSLLDLKAVSCIYSITSEKVKFACLRNMFGVNVLVYIFCKKKEAWIQTTSHNPIIPPL